LLVKANEFPVGAVTFQGICDMQKNAANYHIGIYMNC